MSTDVKSVIERNTDELIKLTLDLANIDSPTGEEGPAAEYVYDWLTRQGFEPRRVALYPNRPNIVATLPGTGGGKSLCFNSHLDTTIHKDEWWTSRHAADPIFHSGWRDGDAPRWPGVVYEGRTEGIDPIKAVVASRRTLDPDRLADPALLLAEV